MNKQKLGFAFYNASRFAILIAVAVVILTTFEEEQLGMSTLLIYGITIWIFIFLISLLFNSSPASQTSPNGDFSKEKEHNIIKRDLGFMLQEGSN